MPWVRLSDDFDQHPRVVEVGALGMALQVAALCWCSRGLTDGRLPRRAARKLLDTDEYAVPIDHVIDELVTAGIWHQPGHDCPRCPQPSPGSFHVHDYLELQPSREQVQSERAAARTRMSRRRGSPGVRPNNTANTGGSSEGSSTPPVIPYPDPVSPLPSPSPSPSARADEDDPAAAITPTGRLRAVLANGTPPPADGWTPAAWTAAALRHAVEPGQIAAVLAEHLAEQRGTPVGPPGLKALGHLLDRHPADRVLAALDDAISRPDVTNPIGYARTTLTNRSTT